MTLIRLSCAPTRTTGFKSACWSAHHQGHIFNVQGLNWLAEPSYLNSGYRNNQTMSISEHFEMNFVVPPNPAAGAVNPSDYLYLASGDTDGVANGLWGLLRSYRGPTDKLHPLPGNPPTDDPPHRQEVAALFRNEGPGARPMRKYDVTAVVARDVLRGPDAAKGLVFDAKPGSAVFDANALVYVRSDDLDASGKLRPGVTLEPLVLRANAGDLIQVTLRNQFRVHDAAGNLVKPFADRRPLQGRHWLSDRQPVPTSRARPPQASGCTHSSSLPTSPALMGSTRAATRCRPSHPVERPRIPGLPASCRLAIRAPSSLSQWSLVP